MKVPLEDGIVLDTEKLTDKEADIHEAMKNLYDVCRRYDVSSACHIVMSPKQYVSMRTVTKDPKKVDGEYDFLMSAIGKFVHDASGGKIVVVRVEEK